MTVVMNPVLIHNWQYLDNGWSLIDSLGAVIDLYTLPGREAISRDLCVSAKPSMLLLGWFLKFHFGIKILISDSTGFAMSAPYGDPSQDTIYSSDPPWHRLQFHQTMQGCKQTIAHNVSYIQPDLLQFGLWDTNYKHSV